MAGACVPVGDICVAPAYARAAEYDYAPRIPPPGGPDNPPGPRIDPAVAERLGVQIKVFSSDNVIPVLADLDHMRCVRGGCVVRGGAELTPTTVRVSWAPVTIVGGETGVYRSVAVTAANRAARDAAVAAISLPTNRPGVFAPLSLMLKPAGG